MPRENSFSDSEGRSLTPDGESDPEDAFVTSLAPPNPVTTTDALRLSRMETRSQRSSLRSRGKPYSPPSIVAQSPWANLTPKEKFRSAALRIMSMRRGLNVLGGGARIGAEPGVDPRRTSADIMYGHNQNACKIEIVDYNSIRSTRRVMNNAEFIEFMESASEEPPAREQWVKVRWINIAGLSWDVIKAVSIKYDLHPLALEDVFHGHARNRSKADYYSRHLFLRVLCHELADTPDTPTKMTELTHTAHISSHPLELLTNGTADAEMVKHSTPSISRKQNPPLLPTSTWDSQRTKVGTATSTYLSRLLAKEGDMRKKREERKKAEILLQAIKKGERVNVQVAPMFFFLFRDGTVISIHPTPTLQFTAPISERLRVRDTVLRKSADASLLIHSLLDLIVDKALEVVDQYHTNINKFEHRILLKPEMKTVRQLHILSGDLILHKRTLEPTKTLVYGLRRYDVDRCAALIDSSDPNNKDSRVVGFMSHKSKIYLADVYDHMEYILSSLDMFAGISQNLIDYSFNVASNEMNEVMRRLTLITIICLPLTLLTGYFGMNFESMWSVKEHSDLFFWELAIPILTVVIPLFMMGDMRRLWHYIEKKTAAKNAIEAYKQRRSNTISNS